LPQVKQPASVPFHISAYTNNQRLLDKPSSLSTLRASTPTGSNNNSTQNINNSEGDLNTESPSKDAKNYRNQKLVKQIGNGLSSSKVRHRTKESKQSLNYLESEANEDEYNQINPSSTGHLMQPQLVPIQTFSFFKWKINVDTLVRIFIIA